MTLDNGWFTEICEEGGSAFSLKIKGKLHEERTPYQTISIYETETFGNLMVIDGFIMLSSRDNFLYHEMLAHPALFTHDHPRRVLIVGGGDCGTLREVLRHPEVEEVWQVEIDERVTRLAERYFPELCAANHDPRARFHFGDGIAWVKEAEAGCYDVIIVDSTDPIGPAEGLFSEPFYRDCLRALGPGGILVQQSESPLFHMDIIQGMHRAMGGAGFGERLTLQFPQCVYPSGWWTATLAARDRSLTTFREGDAAACGFPTRYYSADIHRAALAQPPFLTESLSRTTP
ncbi:MAG TPA: polyamine aminopropyltransferase [Gammaproteobacteria bacterium]|nr:polyamine aminopropyltransferase [Gammaproteobacteria bacterium]